MGIHCEEEEEIAVGTLGCGQTRKSTLKKRTNKCA